MTLHLRIVAIIVALAFFIYTFYIIRKENARIGQVRKWLLLSVVMLLGAIFNNIGNFFAHLVGLTSFAYFSLFALILILLLLNFRFQIALIRTEKEITNLVQEVSILKKRVKDIEHD